MRPNVLIIGCEQDALDSVVSELADANLTARATSSPNLTRTIVDEQEPDVIVISLDAGQSVRKSVEALVHERDPSFFVHQQTDNNRTLSQTARDAAQRWSQTNAR